MAHLKFPHCAGGNSPFFEDVFGDPDMALTRSAISFDLLGWGAAAALPRAVLFVGTTGVFELTRVGANDDDDEDGLAGAAGCDRCAALRSAATARILFCAEA